MTNEALQRALDKYENHLVSVLPEDAQPLRRNHIKEFTPAQERLQHLLWMVYEMRKMIGAPKVMFEGENFTIVDREKIMRWFGFLQGQLDAFDIMTIEQMKEDNRY